MEIIVIVLAWKAIKLLVRAAYVVTVGAFNLVFVGIPNAIQGAAQRRQQRQQYEAIQASAREIEQAAEAQREAKRRERIARAEAARIWQREQEQRRQQLHELKRQQARQDVIFYTETRRDIMKLYNAAEAEYKAAATDRAKETALRRMLSYDAKLRAVDKRREAAALISAI